jgi:hypothetical protein
MFKGKTFQIKETEPTGKTFQITSEKADPIGKTFQIKESWVDEHLRAGGQVLSAVKPGEWESPPWTVEEVLGAYEAGTDWLQKKYPERIDPIEYIRKGLTFGHAPNLPTVPATTIKQKVSETAGFILGATLLRHLTFPILKSAAIKIPGVSKALPALEKTMRKHPWKVGYPISTAVAGAWGALLGGIEKADNKEEWARNVVMRSGIFAGFNVLAYPLLQFFRPVVYEIANNKKYWVDPNIRKALSAPGMQTIYTPPQTLYFRHPTDPKLILKVTQQRVDVLPFSQAPQPANTYPVLAEKQIEVFNYDPSLYSKLKGFLKGKFISHPIKPPPKGADPLMLPTKIEPPPVKPTPPPIKPTVVPPVPETIITPPPIKPVTPPHLSPPGLVSDPEIPKIPATKNITPKIEQEEFAKLTHNQKYDIVEQKLEEKGAEALTTDEIDILSAGKKEIITPSEETPIKPIESEDIVHQKLEELYSGFPLHKMAENMLVTFKGSKRPILDALGSTLIRYYGLTPETKNLLIRLEGKDALRKEDLLGFFEKEFPITKEQAKLLTSHQENPERYPIPPELEQHADKVNSLIEESRKIQEEKGLMEEFFPQSFINRSSAEILQHKEIISAMMSAEPVKIPEHQKTIQELEEYIEFLKGLRYVPHAYLASEEIQRNVLKLLPEGKITNLFRDKLTKLRGRKIATLDDAKEMGLFPEEDIRVLMSSHFEYLYRKVAAHDFVDTLKKNKQAVLPDKDAPDDWQKVAISQLDGYRVNPFLVDAIEDFTVREGTSIADLLLKPYDVLNHLGRSIFFYNPIILPFWDMIQAYGAGTLTPWKPIYSTKLISQARKDVVGKSELYREAVERKLYDPAEAGKFSPSIEEAMKVIISKTDKEYPGWKKAIEEITGKPVDWKTFLVIPDLYKANWKFVWSIDRIFRTATLRHALNMGMDMDTAVKYANNFHANYNIFTKKSRKWLYRAFLVPTYKANMLVNLPKYIGENAIELARGIPKGQTGTPEQKAAASAIFRIGVFVATVLGFAAWREYHLREGYRLVKKIDPEITPEGRTLTERVITLPGPMFEWLKVAGRAIQQKFDGIFMYLAKVPQIAWSLSRNRRWQGDSYYDEGAAPEIQRKQIMTSLLKDYLAPYGQYDIMTKEEQDAFSNIMSMFGMATYKRGSMEMRILWEINEQKSKLQKYLRKPDISQEDRQKAIDYYDDFVGKKIKELEDVIELYHK